MGTTDGPGRVRAGLCCGITAVLVLLTGIAGGLTFLVISQLQEEPTTATFEGKSYRFEYPKEWSEVPPRAEVPNPDQVLELEDAEGDRYVTVLDMQGAMTAEEACQDNAEHIDRQDLGQEQNEVIGSRDIGGRTAIHHRAITLETEKGKRATLLDTWCIPKPDGVILFVAQTFSDDGRPAPMPEAGPILDSWVWTTGPGSETDG